jgi:hypothetical protein
LFVRYNISVEDIPASNLFNYEETYLQENPGSVKAIYTIRPHMIRPLMKYFHILIPQRVWHYCVGVIVNDRIVWGRFVLVSFYRNRTKHVEHVRNHSKTSICHAVWFRSWQDAAPYVVYKGINVYWYAAWCKGGVKNARYSSTKSGWFDTFTCTDWFSHVFLLVAKRLVGRCCCWETTSPATFPLRSSISAGRTTLPLCVSLPTQPTKGSLRMWAFSVL